MVHWDAFQHFPPHRDIQLSPFSCFFGVPSPPPCDSQPSFPFSSPRPPAVCRAGQTQGPTHHILRQGVEPDKNLSQPENLMEGREAPKTVRGVNYPALCKSSTQRPPQQVHVYLTKICPCSFHCHCQSPLLPTPSPHTGRSRPALRCLCTALTLFLV